MKNKLIAIASILVFSGLLLWLPNTGTMLDGFRAVVAYLNLIPTFFLAMSIVVEDF